MMDCLCPKDKEIISKWRREAAESEIYAYISREEVQRVDAGVARELRGIDLQPMRKNQLVELARIIGLPHTGSKQALLTRLQPIITSINGWLIVYLLDIYCITTTNYSAKTFTPIYLDTGDAILGYTLPPIPWMLTKEEIEIVDSRFRNIVIPHNVHAFCTCKEGLLKNRSQFHSFIPPLALMQQK